MTRKDFLTEFLGALGAVDILWQQETDNTISGTVVYEKDTPEERQDFIWHLSEVNTPNVNIYNLAALLNKKRLLNIDQIKTTRESLYSLYNDSYKGTLTMPQFISTLEALKAIEVPMVDDDKETDIYFIHE